MFPMLYLHQCNAYLLSSFGFSPTIKFHSFPGPQATFSHHFPLRESNAWITFAIHTIGLFTTKKIFLPDRANWLRALILITCKSPWQSDTHFDIPRTNTRNQRYLYSKLIACGFWESCIASKKITFSQLYPESLYCHSEKRQFHIHLHISQFPQQILFLNILRLSLKFSNIYMIPFPWINWSDIWSTHVYFCPFFDRAILIVCFFANEPITSIFLFGHFGKFSSVHFKLK